MSVRSSTNRTASVRAPARRLGLVLRAHPHEGRAVPQTCRGIRELDQPLLPHAAADRPDEELVVGDAQLRPHASASLGVGTEPVEVHPVADDPVPPTLEHPPKGVAVSGILEELVVGEPDGQRLQAVDEDSLAQPVLGPGPQPVAGVDDHGDPGEPAGDAPHDPCLGVVGVQDVEVERADDAEQLAERRKVPGGRPGAGEAGTQGRASPPAP